MAYDPVVENAEFPMQITLAAAVKAGELLGYSSGWVKSNAAAGTAIAAELIAGQNGVIGDKITAYRSAVLWDRDAPFTAGALYYVDKTTAGGITATMPPTAGDIDQMVGIAVSTERVIVELHCGQDIRKIHA